jgi:spermidine/putrescine transport system substrate-binding protein
MNVRRAFLRSIAAVAAAAMLAVACSSGDGGSDEQSAGSGASATPGAPSGVLRIFTFEDSQIPEVLDPFKEQYPDVEVQGAAFDSGDEALTKLESGFQTDVVEVCVREVPRYTANEVLMPLDTSRLVGWDDVYPAFKEGGIAADGNTYVAVAQGGAAGVVWNPDLFPTEVTSYKELFEDPALKGQVAMDGTPYYAIAIGALALGYENPYDLTSEDVQKVTDYFIAHKDQFRSFFDGDADFLSLYRNQEVEAAAAFPGYEDQLAKDGMKIGFNFASEGTLTWMCGMGISANAENVDAAYAWLNLFLSTPIQAYFAEKWNYLASNAETLATLPPEVISDLRMDDPGWLSEAIPTQIPPNYDEWLDAMRQIKSA